MDFPLAATGDHSLINSPSAEWENDKAANLLPRALMSGEEAMIACGRTFLPQAIHESDKRYDVRLEMSTLVNAYKKTAEYLSGQVFREEIRFPEDIPGSVNQHLHDVDKAGANVEMFFRRCFVDGVGRGGVVVYVDCPKGDKGLSRAQEKERGIRPYLKVISPQDVLGAVIDGGKIMQVRIKEVAIKPMGLYGTKAVPLVRVLVPGGWELYEITTKGGESKLVDHGKTNLDYIPLFSYLPGDKIGPYHAKSPLSDLAYLNLRHWQSQSEQNSILHYVRIPMLATKGYDLKKIINSTAVGFVSDNSYADMKWVEIAQGGSLAAGWDDLKKIEEAMAIYGLQQLIPRVGNQTATEKVLTSGQSDSVLSMWAAEFDKFIDQCLTAWCDYMGDRWPRGAEVNKKYSLEQFDKDKIAAVYQAQSSGLLSKPSTFAELQSRGVIKKTLGWEEEQAAIEEEARTNPAMAGLAGELLK